MEKVNIAQKFDLFDDYWQPKIAGELNESYLKLVKVKGEFVWHYHEREDELFWVVKGELLIKFRDHEILLQPGEFLIIPRGVEHCPVAKDEVHVVLLEPKTTINTGNADSDLTAPMDIWI